MSTNLIDPRKIWECCVCHAEEINEWGEIAKHGWRSHFVSLDIEAIILCPPCVELMAARRSSAEAT